nr:MAG TPA: hypothetical protein [Caudoviricetes sp.]
MRKEKNGQNRLLIFIILVREIKTPEPLKTQWFRRFCR